MIWSAAMALVTIGFALPESASAQSTTRTFKGDEYAITFSSAWDTVMNNSILGKYLGAGGMATLGAEKSAALPNIDSISAALTDSMGGEVKKDSSGKKTIGTYEVFWQKYTYDSLPTLSAMLAEMSPLATPLKNGSFRVYYLHSNGVAFTIACMSILAGGKGIAPYADIEAAIATLKLGSLAGIHSVMRTGGRDLWVRDGKLGGSWLKTNRVFAVECFDSRGALIGAATHAAEGTWMLPASRQEMFVRLRTAVGTGLHFIVRP
jgi:hypothetical protein